MEFIYSITNALASAHFKIALSIFLFIVLSCYFLLSFTGKQKANKNLNNIERLRSFDKDEEISNKKTNDNYERYIKPYVDKNQSLYNKLLKVFSINIEDLNRDLKKANITKYNADQIATLKVGGILIGCFLGITLGLFIGFNGLLIGFGIFAISMFLPSSLINKEFEKRKKEILRVMPTSLRLLSDATSTAHTIEDSIVKVKRKYKNALSDEFDLAEKEAKYTNDWILALENMVEKCCIDELTNLVSEIKITKQKGTSITEVLINYAKKMDKESMINLTEVARKKTTTLLLPIILFLFGPLIMLILLPALNLVMNSL